MLFKRNMSACCFHLALIVAVLITDTRSQLDVSTKIVCENATLELNCRHGEVLRIIRANFGRFTLAECNDKGVTEGWQTNCITRKAKDIVSEWCDGRNVCAVPVTTAIFTDPCNGTDKYAEVKFKCEKEATDPPAPKPTMMRTTHRIPYFDEIHFPKTVIFNSVVALSPTTVQINYTVEVPVLTVGIYFTSTTPVAPIKPTLVYVSGKSIEPGTRSHDLHDLTPNTSYDIFLKAFKKNSASLPTRILSVTTLPDDKRMPPAIEIRVTSGYAKNVSKTSLSSYDRILTNEERQWAASRDSFQNITYIKQPVLQWEDKQDQRMELDKLLEQNASTTSHSLDNLLEQHYFSTNNLQAVLNESNIEMLPEPNFPAKLISEPGNENANISKFEDDLNNDNIIKPNVDKELTQNIPMNHDATSVNGNLNYLFSSWSKTSSLSQTTTILPSFSYLSLASAEPFYKPPTSSLTGPTSSLTGPTSSLTGSTSSLTGPTSSLTGPTSSLTGPTSSLTGPTSSLTGPTSSLTGPTSSLTGPTSSLTGLSSTQVVNLWSLSATNSASIQPTLSSDVSRPTYTWTTYPTQALNGQSSHEVDKIVYSIFENTTTLKPEHIEIGFITQRVQPVGQGQVHKATTTTRRSPTKHPATTTTATPTTWPTTRVVTRASTAYPVTETTMRPTNIWIPSSVDEDLPPEWEEINEDVSDKVCPRGMRNGVLWPATKFGRRAQERCPNQLNGVALWECLDGGWESTGPDLSNCYSKWLAKMEIAINDMMIGKAHADDLAVALSEKVKEENMTAGDIKKTATTFLPGLLEGIKKDNVSDTLTNRRTRMRKFKKAYLSTGSGILGRKHSLSWQSLSKLDRQRSATSLLLRVEELGFQSARLMDTGTKELEVNTNIVFEVHKVDSKKASADVTFPTKNDQWSQTDWAEVTDSITIPSVNLQLDGQTGITDIVFSLYKNMGDLIPPQLMNIASMPASPEANSHFNSGTIRDNNARVDSSLDMLVNSRIISASLNGTRLKRRLHKPVTFTLQHIHLVQEAVPICSYWSMDTSSLNGKWAVDGCTLVDTNSTHTTCSCNHLTNFALLMDVTGVKLSEESEAALRIITYVGCIISIVCLMLSWITFMVFKNLQCDRNTIHKNLVLSLLLAEIVFLAGIGQVEPKLLCSIIAGVLHYLFLGAFAWMCLEGVQLYVMLIEVFEQERSRVKWYYLFGYGVPAVIVGISAAIYHQGYGTEKHCWLTTQRSFIWAFVGPALAVMLVNIVMLGIAIYIMCRHSNMSAGVKERSKVTKFSVSDSLSSMETFASPKLRFPDLPVWLKGAMVLVVLLGLTWLLGVLYLNKESQAVAYLFTILNSLQGMFIFIFHCLRNEKVQKEYRKVARRTSWLPNCIRVNYGGYNGVASSSPNASTGTGNYLSRIFGQGKRKRSAASTNSSAKPFLSHDNNHRRSDLESSSSRETSSAPVSLNGYIYTPGYSNAQQYPVSATSSVKNMPTKLINPVQLAPCCEADGIGDLSEYLDCSVVDSEFVSEYCQHNMQVSMEEKRYSTGSEDSKVGRAPYSLRLPENDNLSTLSLASSSRKPSSTLSSSEVLSGSEQKLGARLDTEAVTDPRLNFNQYIIPSSRKSVNNNSLNVSSNQGSEPRSASMNKLSKPSTSLSSIPETEHSPQHSSAPNIQLTLGFRGRQSDSASSTMANTPDSVVNHRHFPVSDYEEISPSSTMESPSSIKSSLPNLDMLTIECEHMDHDCVKRRHSSETDVQFSPFRFTAATEC